MTGVNGSHSLGHVHRVVCIKCNEEQGLIRERVKRIMHGKRILAIVTPEQMIPTLRQLGLKPNQYKVEDVEPFAKIPTICKACNDKQAEEHKKIVEAVEAGGVLCECPTCGERGWLDKDHQTSIETRKHIPIPKHALVKVECDQCLEKKKPAANDEPPKSSIILPP